MGLFYIPAWLAFPVLMRAAQRLALPRALSLPVAWVAVEWLRITLAIGHFDIFLLGYSQARFVRLAQVADLLGVYGVSFLVAAVNGLIADAFFAWRDSGWSRAALLANRRLKRSAWTVLFGIALAAGYGAVRIATIRSEPGPRLAIIQPNLGHAAAVVRGVFLSELAQTDEAIPPGSADLIVWPENAILDDIDRKDAYLGDLRILLDRKKAWLLLGAQGHSVERPDRPTNSAFLLDDEGRIRGRSDKTVLYPWTEYVPFDGALGTFAPPLQRIQRAIVRKAWGTVGTGAAGARLALLRIPWTGAPLPFATLICVENSNPPVVAEAGRMGARFLVNITSEGALGGPIQEQLLRVCILRAVENRIPYVRAGNTGISGFIGPDGRVRSVLTGPRGRTVLVPGTLTDRVALSTRGPTVYARSHDAFALLCVAGAAGLALAGARRKVTP